MSATVAASPASPLDQHEETKQETEEDNAGSEGSNNNRAAARLPRLSANICKRRSMRRTLPPLRPLIIDL